MTRGEEIIKAARVYANGIAQHLPNKKYCEEDFSTGAEWADRTMIDKACKWLREQLQNTTFNGEPLFCEIEETLEDFRKAMKWRII